MGPVYPLVSPYVGLCVTLSTSEVHVFLSVRLRLQELLIGHDSWSIAELTQAIVIMSHYHSLASFALGCGLTPEVDTPCGHTFNQDTPIATTFANPSLCLTNEVAIETSHSEGSVVSNGGSCVSPMEMPQYHQITNMRVEHYMQSESPVKMLSVLHTQQHKCGKFV